MNTLPQSVRAALWSYDTEQLDIARDRVRIITNVLNGGTKSATDWLLSVYPHEQVIEVVAHPLPGEWNKKSLNFWAIALGVTPQIRNRFS